MFEVNDVVRFKYNNTTDETIGVITKVNHKDYVQILSLNGKVFDAVYTGYLRPLNKKLDIMSILKELALIWVEEQNNG